MITEHGTARGYHQHRKQGEKPCDPCRLAYNEYMVEYRRQRKMFNDVQLALETMADRYPQEFDDVLAEIVFAREE